MDPQTRRRWLATCVGTGVAGLAGCTSRGGDDSDSSDDRSDDGIQTDDSDDVPLDIGDETDEPAPDEWLMTGVDLENTGYHPTASGPTGDVSERWTFEIGKRVVSNPMVVNDIVYCSFENEKLYGVDIESGQEVFSADHGIGFFTATPTVDKYHIYGPSLKQIQAIDIETGEEKWRSGIDEFEAVGGPKLANDTIYTNCEDGQIVGINLEEGEINWQHEISGRGSNSLSIINGNIYATAVPAKLYAINIANNDRLWEQELDGTSMGIAADEDTVYIGVQDGQAILAYDGGTGDQLWEQKFDGEVHSSISLSEGKIVARVEDKIVAVSKENGSVMWDVDNKGVRSNLSIADGIVYTRSNIGVSAFELESGNLAWEYEIEGVVTTTPTVVSGYLFVGDDDGYLHALN